MDRVDRERRHDEAWQKEVLDGLARMIDVLHDISDGIQQLVEASAHAPTPVAAEQESNAPQLFSVRGLAEHLGVSPSVIYGLRTTGDGPVSTKLGSRLYFHRDDVAAWLSEQRQDPGTATRPWRGSHLPGRIGSTIPRSSEPLKRTYCTGSHTEPMAASKYSGRAVCRVCRDDVIVNRDGRLRKHYPRGW